MKDHDATPDQPSAATRADVAPLPPRRPYSSPSLKLYGSVSKLTLSGGASGAEGGSGMAMVSDPEVKENAVRIGEHPLGIGLYLFDYKPEFRQMWGSGRQFGVMADEAERVLPEAVRMHADGYRRVNYTMLGIAHADN